MVPQYKRFLENVPLLSELTPYDVITIADALKPVTYSAGDVVVREGDLGDYFFIVESGEVKVTRVFDEEEKDHEVWDRLGAGQHCPRGQIDVGKVPLILRTCPGTSSTSVS